MKTDKIYLVGFMGAGKTSLARTLARRLGWETVDLDERIERREHATVADIFARHGEPYFRSLERAVLLEELPRRHLIVATGGGTYVDPQNRAAINRDGVVVWLDVPLDRLLTRVPTDGSRPLAASRADFERLFHIRQAAYQQAHIRLEAGRFSVNDLAEQLIDRLDL